MFKKAKKMDYIRELTVEENKSLCEKFPFLLPSDVFNDEPVTDYNYDYVVGLDEIPFGWRNLFVQMCEDILPILIENNYLDKFRFEQVKEKFGNLRAYHNCNIKEVNDIISKYEYISEYVCMNCGKPATKQTKGWISEYCDDCMKIFEQEPKCTDIKRDLIYVTYRFQDEDTTREEYDCTDIWDRLYGGE